MIKLLLLLTLFIAGCNKGSETQTAEKIFTIDVTRKALDVNYEEIADNMRIVPLEAKKDAFIAEITKLAIDDDLIFVFDVRNQHILKFDINGKFISGIGMKGRSKKEYQFFNDIYVDREKNFIYAYERYRNQMYIYNYNGELQKQIKCAVMFNSFAKVDDEFWVYSCFETKACDKFNLTHLDSSLQNIKAQYFPQMNNFVGASFESTFSSDDDGNTYFYYPMSDGIYKITSRGVEYSYKFDFGSRTKPYDLLQKTNNHMDQQKILNDTKYLGGLSNLQFYKNYLFINFKESNIGVSKRYTFCYDQANDKENLIRGISKERTFYGQVLGSYDGSLITNIAFVANNKILREEFNISSKLDDNPILVFFDIDNLDPQ